MDAHCRNLYFFTMRRRQPTASGRGVNPPIPVPAFFLYGEPLRPPDERMVHIETIAARSRIHNWIIAAHRHRDLHQVLFIRHGRVEARIDGRTAQLRAPSAIVVPPGAVHSFRFQPETAGVVVSFAPRLAGELRDPGVGLPPFLERCAAVTLPRSALGMTDLASLSEMLLREFDRSAPGRRLALSGLLTALLANLQRLLPDPSPRRAGVNARDRELVARFREQVERQFRKHTGIGEYAALLQTSETRLLRACLAVTGEPPLELVHLRLLVEAERHLLHTSMSIAQIAYHLGFEDPAYFSRFFSRRSGTSPRAYRRRDVLTIHELGRARPTGDSEEESRVDAMGEHAADSDESAAIGFRNARK